MAEATTRPLPVFPEPDTKPFWEATKSHELRYQTCDDCAGVVFFPRRHCTHCMSMKLSWRTSKGEGTVYTYTVIRQIGLPWFKDRVPYTVAWIDLDEGFRILSSVVGVDDPTTDVRVGQRVRVRWEDQENGLSLPLFTPA
ncbi:MAG: OB-fold domain-containing protein [Dehalococcoidia bacterium]